MNIDLLLLKLMLSKEYFSKYSKIINLEFYKQNNREVYRLFLTLFKLHETDKESLSVEDLTLFYYSLYPMAKPEEKTLLDAILNQLSSTEIDESLALEYLNKHHEQTVATQIALEALNVSRGQGSMGTVRELMASLEAGITEDIKKDWYHTINLEEILAEINSDAGIRWPIETMNKSLGSLRKGNFGFLVKRPETGGTTFAAHLTSHTLKNTDKNILWVHNEEAGYMVVLKVSQSYFGITYQEVQANSADINAQFGEEVGDRFRFHDNALASKQDIEAMCKERTPDLIIIDQIDKLKGFPDKDREDIRLGNIYIWARELAKQYCPVIGVTQASGEAEGKKYLTMDMVANSKTAKQAEADWILGIGMTHVDGEEFIRYLSIMKNKLLGDADTIPNLRHAKMPIIIHPEIARFSDSINWG